MIRRFVPIIGLCALSACATQPPPPPLQPTTAAAISTLAELNAVQADGTPAQFRDAGLVYVNRLCDSWLVASAQRTQQLAAAQQGLSAAGTAATGLLGLAGASLPAVAGVGVGAGLVNGLFAAKATAGLSDSDAGMVSNALSAYEAALPAPASYEAAALQFEGAYKICTPFGATQLADAAKMTALITASPVSAPSLSAAQSVNAVAASLWPVPVVRVNGR